MGYCAEEPSWFWGSVVVLRASPPSEGVAFMQQRVLQNDTVVPTIKVGWTVNLKRPT